MFMRTVQVKSNITFEELINGVLQLDAPDFEKFIEKVQELKKHQNKAIKSDEETKLIIQAKENLSQKDLFRLKELEQKQYDSSLTKAEQEEMESFIQRLEKLHFQRILAIGQLAQLRGQSVDVITKELGFKTILNG